MNGGLASNFDYQAAVLAELGMDERGAAQWLSDTWLLAERSAAPHPSGSVPISSGPLLDGVYRELEALERVERARVLRAALRFELRCARGAPGYEDAGDGNGATPGSDLRAAALDLVLPFRSPGSGANSGANRGNDRLRKMLGRESARPVSERLFGPRDATIGDRRIRDGAPAPPSRCVDPGAVLDAICRASAPIQVNVRTPQVVAALWGLMHLNSTLGPGIETAAIALECRLVLGEKPPGLVVRCESGRYAIPLASSERIELAQLVVSGDFVGALRRSCMGNLRRDHSPSLGAIRAALRHRLSGPISGPDPPTARVACEDPSPGEIQRIARFLVSMEEAWPGPGPRDRDTGGGTALSPSELHYLGRPGTDGGVGS